MGPQAREGDGETSRVRHRIGSWVLKKEWRQLLRVRHHRRLLVVVGVLGREKRAGGVADKNSRVDEEISLKTNSTNLW